MVQGAYHHGAFERTFGEVGMQVRAVRVGYVVLAAHVCDEKLVVVGLGLDHGALGKIADRHQLDESGVAHDGVPSSTGSGCSAC